MLWGRYSGFAAFFGFILGPGALMALVLVLGCGPGPTPPDPEPPLGFLALGDSYTIGISVDAPDRWPVQLTAAMEALPKIAERGLNANIIAENGWRTDNLFNAIRAEAPGSEWDLVSLLIGVNDFFQGRPIEEYDERFPALLDTAIALAGGRPERVFVVSIPDYAFTPFGQGTTDPDAISVGLDTFNAHAERFAAERGVDWFYITDISREGLADPELVASDGLHPSGKQYGRWVEERLMPAVAEKVLD
jgi:lysophospholipase L1-like esterase